MKSSHSKGVTGIDRKQVTNTESSRGATRIRDVAERAGVSPMTVSLALRTDEASLRRVSAETRERVQQVARELNYVPSVRAGILRYGVTNIIGLYAGIGQLNVNLPFFAQIVNGLQEGCERHGKNLLLHGTFKNRSSEDIYSQVREGLIDGLVMFMPSDPSLPQQLSEARFPVVSLAQALPGVPSIGVDESGGTRLLAQHLYERGHRRCAYVLTDVFAESFRQRHHAFVSAAAELGLAVTEHEISEPLLLPEGSDQQGTPANSSAALLQNWLLQPPLARPSVFAFWNDAAAYNFLLACRQQRVRVPDEVAVVGFDGCATPEQSFWNLTTVRAPWSQVAGIAVDQLDALIKGQDVPQETVLPVQLWRGHTT